MHSPEEAEKRMVMMAPQSYRCVSCDYLFGNLSDLKRHLKVRHGIHASQIEGLDQSSASEFQVLINLYFQGMYNCYSKCMYMYDVTHVLIGR